MKRFLSMLATGALALGLSTAAHAQRSFGVGSLVIDDNHGHKVTITAPIFGSPEGNAWALTTPPYMPLTWSIPVPPANNAQAGFMYAGPLVPNTFSTTGPSGPGTALAQPYTLPVWINPGYQGFNHYGGPAGAWDYATTSQLGIPVLNPPLSNTANIIPKTDGAGSFNASAATDNGTTYAITDGLTAASLNSTPIGVATPAAGNFTSIGATTQGTGAFTTVNA